MEGGDDIGVQGPGIEKNAGGSGYDWSIAATSDQGGDDQPMDSDLDLPLIPLDILDGRRPGPLQRGRGALRRQAQRHPARRRRHPVHRAAAAASSAATRWTPQASPGSRASTRWSRTLPDPGLGGRQRRRGRACDLHGNVWGEGNILLGGAGDDTIEGRLGDDIIDGDRYLNVRLSVRDDDGNEIRSARSMTELQADVFAGKINPKNIVAVREILTSATPDNDTAVFSGTRAQYAITRSSAASWSPARTAPTPSATSRSCSSPTRPWTSRACRPCSGSPRSPATARPPCC